MSPADRAKIDAQRKSVPHFWNLNEDSALTDMIVHFVRTGEMKVGNSKAQPPADILLNGLRYRIRIIKQTLFSQKFWCLLLASKKNTRNYETLITSELY